MNKVLDIFGTYSSREVKKIMPLVEKIEALRDTMKSLSDGELQDKTYEFKYRLAGGETLNSLLPEAFAVVREASFRVLNKEHYRVQLIGGIVLHQGRIAEMKTGEGKTLVATLPAYLNALEEKGVHVVTTNDYLAKRDREEMGKIHEFLGLSVDVILNEKTPTERRAAYAADITYGTNNELGFDYLKDNLVLSKDERVQRELNYVIIDEIDSILIDEARTPLIIAGDGNIPSEIYLAADRIIKKMAEGVHYKIDHKVKAVTLTDVGMDLVESDFSIEDYSAGHNRIIQHHVVQALKANYTMKINKDYIVKGDEVLIVDEFTGRVMDGRRFSEGLHEAIEAKEGLEVNKESKTLATITLQNFFRLYTKMSGMTGTAVTEEEEFRDIYKLDVISIPTNKPVIRADNADIVYKTLKEKYKSIIDEIVSCNAKGQPVLVGTASIAKSEDISALLKRRSVKHSVLNAKNHEREAQIISRAGEVGAVTIATNMAGRGTDIILAPGVAELGGLKVIGTDKHESRRIDNQLRGRSGRQGDPGSTQFILSLQDDMVVHFVPDRFKKLFEGIETKDNEPIDNKWVAKAIESSQKAVEGNNFSARKNVIGYDDVINVQRKLIFEERNKVLDREEVTGEILTMLKDVISKSAQDFLGEVTEDDFQAELNNLLTYVEGICIPNGAITLKELSDMPDELIVESFKTIALEVYAEAEESFGEALKDLERKTLLTVVDEKWIDHIDGLDFLKQGIGLRAFKNQDPVQAFQMEAAQLFDEMIYSIKLNTVTELFKTISTPGVQNLVKKAAE